MGLFEKYPSIELGALKNDIHVYQLDKDFVTDELQKNGELIDQLNQVDIGDKFVVLSPMRKNAAGLLTHTKDNSGTASIDLGALQRVAPTFDCATNIYHVNLIFK